MTAKEKDAAAEAPTISVPLESWVRQIVTETTASHREWCSQHGPGARVAKLEISYNRLLGFMLGSGAIGGAAATFIGKIIGV